MFIIDFAAGVLTAALAGLGVGGGGLLVIYLTLVKDIPQIEAQGINLLFFIAAGASSCIIHLKKRNINKKALILMIFFGGIGAVVGSILVKHIGANVIKTVFGIFLICSGTVELFSKFKDESDKANVEK